MGRGGRRRVAVRQCKVAGSVEGQAGPGPDPSPGLEGQWGKEQETEGIGISPQTGYLWELTEEEGHHGTVR